jgi:hypothetical protein
MRLLALSGIESLLDFAPSPDLWRPFFPGVFGGLFKVVMGDYKQGSRVTTLALKLLLRITAMLTDDAVNASVLQAPGKVESPQVTLLRGLRDQVASASGSHSRVRHAEVGPCYAEIAVPEKIRRPLTRDWAQELLRRVAEVMPMLIKACRHNASAQVRCELIEGARLLLGRSGGFLMGLGGDAASGQGAPGEALVVSLVDALVGAQDDDMPDVAGRAKAALTQLQGGAAAQVMTAPSRLLPRLEGLLRELEGATASSKEIALRSTLDLITGFFTLLGSHRGGIRQFLTAYMAPFLASLSRALEFDRGVNVQVIDPLQDPSNSAARAMGYYRMSFKHFRDGRCLESVKRLLACAGGKGEDAAYLVADQVVDDLRRGGRAARRGEGGRGGHGAQLDWVFDRLPQVFILNKVILGGAGREGLEAAVRLYLEGILMSDSGVWHLPTCNAPDARSEPSQGDQAQPKALTGAGLSVDVLTCHALMVSLLVEGVADCFEALGSASSQFLMTALYPVVEKMGDEHPLVRQAALTSLWRMGQAVGAGSIQALLATNLDYLVDALSFRIRRSQWRRGVFPVQPGVVECLLTYTGGSVALPLMKEVTGLVLGVVDLGGRGDNTAYTLGMMHVLHAMVRNARRDDQAETPAEAPKSQEMTHPPSAAGTDQVRCMRAADFWRDQVLADLDYLQPSKSDAGSVDAASFFREHHRNKEGTCSEGGEEFLEVEKMCPEAFEQPDALASAQEGENGDKPNDQEALLIEVLDRCTYFLARPSLLVQHTVLHVMIDALWKLRSKRGVLLPTVHRIWGALVARLGGAASVLYDDAMAAKRYEQGADAPDSARSWAALVMSKVLNLAAELADLCGDFMALKFGEDLWPIMKRTLATYRFTRKRSLLSSESIRNILPGAARESHDKIVQSRGSSSSSSSALVSVDLKLLQAAVKCLRRFCATEQCFRFTTPLVPDMGQACLFLLAREEDDDLMREVIPLYKLLFQLDGAALWPTFMELAGFDISVTPIKELRGRAAELPQAQWPGVTDRERGLVRARARAILEDFRTWSSEPKVLGVMPGQN